MASKAKQYQVLLTQGAEQDLEALYDYIAEFQPVSHVVFDGCCDQRDVGIFGDGHTQRAVPPHPSCRWHFVTHINGYS